MATMARTKIGTMVVETASYHVRGDVAAPLGELGEQRGEGIADHAEQGPVDIRLHSSFSVELPWECCTTLPETKRIGDFGTGVDKSIVRFIPRRQMPSLVVELAKRLRQ